MPDGGTPFVLRAIAANLTSGNGQSWDLGHGQRILQALQGDVVLLQEFKFGNNTPAAFNDFIRQTFDAGTGPQFSWVRGPAGQNIPNGIASRWPILEGGDWVDPQVVDRGFTWARIDLPGPRDLWAISVHLHTQSASSRATEGRAIVTQMQAKIPAKDLILIGGDFNVDSTGENVFTVLSSRFSTGGLVPIDQDGAPGTNRNRDKPYDQVLASPCLRRHQVPAVVGGSTFDAGLVFDTRVFAPIASVPPAQTGDSAAASMQHMAVVKDYVIAQ